MLWALAANQTGLGELDVTEVARVCAIGMLEAEGRSISLLNGDVIFY